MEKIIFNSSMPRSGSELLQVVLHQNPKIYGSVTSPLLEYQFGAKGNSGLPEVKSQNKFLMEKAFDSVCKGIAYSYYDALTDKPIVCDKNRGWFFYREWIERWNPNPKIIVMIRDLRSILASMERIHRKNKHKNEAIEDNGQIRNMTVDARMNYWLSSFPIGLSLQRLQNALQTGVAEKLLFVKYEDFCNNPKEQMKKIYDYIEEPYFEHDFNNIVKEIQENDSYYGIYGQHQVQKSLRSVKKADWSDVLSGEIAEGVRVGCRWYFETFKF